ncbi:hypothetical protein DMA11_10245 [Marinilabiliaceae bacterium JC017]|nr:hypothetical protein DMA11_10245 [Marinilabiliaceae bacterium JC017]
MKKETPKGKVTFDDFSEWLDAEPKEAMKRQFALDGNMEDAIQTESFLLWYLEKYGCTPDSIKVKEEAK